MRLERNESHPDRGYVQLVDSEVISQSDPNKTIADKVICPTPLGVDYAHQHEDGDAAVTATAADERTKIHIHIYYIYIYIYMHIVCQDPWQMFFRFSFYC